MTHRHFPEKLDFPNELLPPIVQPEHHEDLRGAFIDLFDMLVRVDQRPTDADEERALSIATLHASHTFLSKFVALDLLTPLVRLISGLQGLETNSVIPMLRPKKLKGRTAAPPLAYIVKAVAVYGVEQLHNAGMDLQEAFKFAARPFQRLEIKAARLGGHVTARTIRGWYADRGTASKQAEMIELGIKEIEQLELDWKTRDLNQLKEAVEETIRNCLLDPAVTLQYPKNQLTP